MAADPGSRLALLRRLARRCLSMAEPGATHHHGASMTLTIELYACSEPGTPVACTVPDGSLPAGAPVHVRLARALTLVATRLPRAIEAGDIVVAEGTRYFVTSQGFQAVPANYQPTLDDLLVGFPDIQPDAR